MSSSLKENILTLGDEQFTGENLNQLKSESTSVKIVNVSSGQRYDIIDTSYEVIIFEQSTGKLDKTILIQSDDTGSFVLPAKNVILVLLKGAEIKNWGDYNWNLHPSDISYLLDYEDYESTLTGIDTSISYKTYQGTSEDVTTDPDAKPFIYEESLPNISTSINYKTYQPNVDNILISTSYKSYQSTLGDVSFSTSTQ